MNRHERRKIEKPLWMLGDLRPVWREGLRTIVETTAPYEQLFLEFGGDGKDFRDLTEILQTSGVLNPAIKNAGRFVARIENDLFREWKFATHPKQRPNLARERQRAFDTLDHIQDIAKHKAPLLYFFLREGAVVTTALSMQHTIEAGQMTMQDYLREIEARERNEHLRTMLPNILRVMNYASRIDPRGPLAPIEPDLQETIDLYSNVECVGEHLFHGKMFNKEAWVDVDAEEEKNPFIFGRACITIGPDRLNFFISRLNGELLLDGAMVIGAEGVLQNPVLYSRCKKLVWLAVQDAIAKGKFVEKRVVETVQEATSAEDPIEHAGEEEILEDDDAAPEIIEQAPEVENNFQPYIPPAVVVEQPSELQPEVVGEDRVYIPPLSYRQMTRALVGCKVRIEPAGKHLSAVRGEYDTPYYNPHKKSERKFQSSEVHRILEALHIEPALFLSKI